jgi:hypothetical protein
MPLPVLEAEVDDVEDEDAPEVDDEVAPPSPPALEAVASPPAPPKPPKPDALLLAVMPTVTPTLESSRPPLALQAARPMTTSPSQLYTRILVSESHLVEVDPAARSAPVRRSRRTLAEARERDTFIVMRRHAALVRLAMAAIALFAYAACEAKGTTTGAAGSGGATVSGTGGASSSTDGSGGDFLSVGAGPSCEEACSGDLKKVTCDGVVTKECGPDEACLGGTCSTDVCGAANAAKSSYGCDYWALKPDIISAVRGACFAAFIANTWSSSVHISVEYKGQPLQGQFIRIPQGQGAGLTYQPYDRRARGR